jgi:hypothetical protein
MTCDGARESAHSIGCTTCRFFIVYEPGDDARLLRASTGGQRIYRAPDQSERAARVGTHTGVKRNRYIEHLRVRCSMKHHQAASRFPCCSSTSTIQVGQRQPRSRRGRSSLREFATRIRRNTRGIDLSGRLGGEEFVVVMPDSDPSPRPITSPRRRSNWAEEQAPSSYGRSNPPTTRRSLF